MTFYLFWADFWFWDNLFGFGILSVKREDFYRSLFAIYYNDGELLIDLFWFRIITVYSFWGREK